MPHLFCIGAAHWDIIGHSATEVALGADVPGRIIRKPGGVALNIAIGLVSEGNLPALIAALGDDQPGQDLRAWLKVQGISIGYMPSHPGLCTDSYLAVEGANGLIAAIADTNALESLGAEVLERLPANTKCVLLDSGLAPAVLADMAQSPKLAQVDLRLAAASPAKAVRLAPFLGHSECCFYLNVAEAGALCGTTFADSGSAARALVSHGAARVVVTDGPRAATEATAAGFITAQPPYTEARRVTGAGDAFAAAHISAELRGQTRADALNFALDAASRHVATPLLHD